MLIHFQWVSGGGGRVVSMHSLEPQVKPRCLEDLIKITNVVIIKVFVGGGLSCLVGLGFVFRFHNNNFHLLDYCFSNFSLDILLSS